MSVFNDTKDLKKDAKGPVIVLVQQPPIRRSSKEHYQANFPIVAVRKLAIAHLIFSALSVFIQVISGHQMGHEADPDRLSGRPIALLHPEVWINDRLPRDLGRDILWDFRIIRHYGLLQTDPVHVSVF